MVVAEDSMVVAVAADQLRIRKIVLPPQVRAYVFSIFGFFVSTFSNFFVEFLLFEFFYSIFRILNFRVSIFINVSILEFRFSDFEFFDISIFRVSNNFRIFSIFDFSDFGFFAQLLLSSLLVKFFGHFVKFATNRQVSSLTPRYD